MSKKSKLIKRHQHLLDRANHWFFRCKNEGVKFKKKHLNVILSKNNGFRSLKEMFEDTYAFELRITEKGIEAHNPIEHALYTSKGLLDLIPKFEAFYHSPLIIRFGDKK